MIVICIVVGDCVFRMAILPREKLLHRICGAHVLRLNSTACDNYSSDLVLTDLWHFKSEDVAPVPDHRCILRKLVLSCPKNSDYYGRLAFQERMLDEELLLESIIP